VQNTIALTCSLLKTRNTWPMQKANKLCVVHNVHRSCLEKNSGSILENQCHQEDPFPSHGHKFSYHQLKKHIRERQKNNYISSIGHHLQRSPNIRFHRSKKIVSKVKKQKEQIHVGISMYKRKMQRKSIWNKLKTRLG
jgi:hypothetical protein